MEANALHFKILADQLSQIDLTGDHIAPDQSGRAILQLKCCAKLFKNFEGKKRDLSLVIFLIIEEAISANAMTGHTLNGSDFQNGVFIRFAPMMTKKVMARRNVKMTDFHRDNGIITGGQLRQRPRKNLIDRMRKESAGIDPDRVIRRNVDGSLEFRHDELTVEEPLEIRLERNTIATTMRTPGHDEELAAGFLVSEAIIRDRDQIAKITPAGENVIMVELAEGVKVTAGSAQRYGTISTSCGICGKNSIDAIRQNFPVIAPRKNIRIEIKTLLSLPPLLLKQQGEFARTGGIHAAGVFDLDGELEVVREDIGRHNAVDKVIGQAFLKHFLPLDRHVLLVSGRASFEIMQKALAAGIPIVAAVSAPSTLAVNFARESNQTLIGFLRPPSFNVYSHIERVILK
jgi:FdhD protein